MKREANPDSAKHSISIRSISGIHPCALKPLSIFSGILLWYFWGIPLFFRSGYEQDMEYIYGHADLLHLGQVLVQKILQHCRVHFCMVV